MYNDINDVEVPTCGIRLGPPVVARDLCADDILAPALDNDDVVDVNAPLPSPVGNERVVALPLPLTVPMVAFGGGMVGMVGMVEVEVAVAPASG